MKPVSITFTKQAAIQITALCCFFFLGLNASAASYTVYAMNGDEYVLSRSPQKDWLALECISSGASLWKEIINGAGLEILDLGIKDGGIYIMGTTTSYIDFTDGIGFNANGKTIFYARFNVKGKCQWGAAFGGFIDLEGQRLAFMQGRLFTLYQDDVTPTVSMQITTEEQKEDKNFIITTGSGEVLVYSQIVEQDGDVGVNPPGGKGRTEGSTASSSTGGGDDKPVPNGSR